MDGEVLLLLYTSRRGLHSYSYYLMLPSAYCIKAKTEPSIVDWLLGASLYSGNCHGGQEAE
jgi:hypothetical protein